MGGPIPVREYTNEAEMRERYGEVVRRCFAPHVVDRLPATAVVREIVGTRAAFDSSVLTRSMTGKPWKAPQFVETTNAIPDLEKGLSAAQAVGLAARATGIGPAEIRGDHRAPLTVKARHIAFWLAVRRGGSGYAGTGRAIGDKDHSTVAAGVARVDAVIAALQLCLSEDHYSTARQLWEAPWPAVCSARKRWHMEVKR